MALVMALAMMVSVVGVVVPKTPVAASPDDLIVDQTSGPYYTIQSAIDASTAGDTIIVHDGEYHEQLFIDINLTIVSVNGSAVTTINGTGLTDFAWVMDWDGAMTIYPVVWIDASEVVFGNASQGFTITGATLIEGLVEEGPPAKMGVGMLNLASHCTIEGNIFLDNIVGYWSWYQYSASSNQILNNEFSGNVLALQLIEGGGDTVSGNTFTENMWAIILEGGGSHQILNNTLNLNAQGIEFHGSHGNIISGNQISDTTGEDWVVGGDGIVVPIDGVAIELMESDDNTIGNNTIFLNDTIEYAANYGIRLNGSSGNDIVGNNTISDCHNDGILLQGGSNQNLVQDNTVNGNMSTMYGIALNQSDNNDVLGNEVYNCLTGIHVYTPMPGSGNQIGGTQAGEGNTVYDCKVGIVLDNSWNEAVVGNTAYNCTYGIYLINSHGITVERNITYGNVTGESPVGNNWGIYLESSGGIPEEAPPNTIRGNDISYNIDVGLVLDAGSHRNSVTANKIHNNGHGIWIAGDNNFICGNDIRDNTGLIYSGVHLTADAQNNQIHCNNIVGNTVRVGGNIISWGMYKEGGSKVDAQDNWWGDPNGPGGVGPGGVGDAVNKYVNFAPWSTTEFTFPDVTGPVIVADTAAVPDTISLLDTDFLRWVMGGAPYSIGPSYTDLIVDTGCERCEATSVTVDLSALVLDMLPEDIDKVVAGWDKGKQNEWHNWLNQLENTPMGQHWYWDYELHLDWLLGELGGFFDYNELMDMVFEEFRLGEFKIPVTAVDCSGNPTEGVITLAIVDFQLPMEEEWNIRSSPIALNGTWGDIKDMGNVLSYEAIVMWDAENWEWVEPSSNATMAPLQAYYIKLSENDQLGLIIEREATGPPQRQLYVGWNLVGLAPDIVDWGFGGMPLELALASIYQAAGGVPGWGIAISPGAPGMDISYIEQFSYNDIPLEKPWYEKWFHQNAWTAYPGYGDWMSSGGGYWVYMDNDDVLAGLSYTPLPWQELVPW